MDLGASFLTGGWREQCFNVSIRTVFPDGRAVGRSAQSSMLFVVYLWLNLSHFGANEVLNGANQYLMVSCRKVDTLNVEVLLLLRLELLVRPLEEVDLLAVVLLVRHLLLRRALLYHLARALQVRYFLQDGGGDRVARLIAI